MKQRIAHILMWIPSVSTIIYAVIFTLLLSSCATIREHRADLIRSRQFNICRKFLNPVNHSRQLTLMTPRRNLSR